MTNKFTNIFSNIVQCKRANILSNIETTMKEMYSFRKKSVYILYQIKNNKSYYAQVAIQESGLYPRGL